MVGSRFLTTRIASKRLTVSRSDPVEMCSMRSFGGPCNFGCSDMHATKYSAGRFVFEVYQVT